MERLPFNQLGAELEEEDDDELDPLVSFAARKPRVGRKGDTQRTLALLKSFVRHHKNK